MKKKKKFNGDGDGHGLGPVFLPVELTATNLMHPNARGLDGLGAGPAARMD